VREAAATLPTNDELDEFLQVLGDRPPTPSTATDSESSDRPTSEISPAGLEPQAADPRA